MNRSQAFVHKRGVIVMAVLLLAPLHRAAPPRDLEVGVPPGSPTAWGRWLPALTPRREPLFPHTGPRPGQGGGRTVAARPKLPIEPRLGGAGMLRITTADVGGHLTWVNGREKPAGPVTGPAGRQLPSSSATMQWIGTAAFLRLMLHRQQLSAAEVIAHLVELGEPALGSADAAASERSLEAISGEVRTRIERRGRGTALPVGANPREAMLLRMVADELGAAHPYDPEGTFGQRMYVFAAEVEPLLVRILTTDADPFLVRNATAALGRYRTSTAQAALVAAAATTRDDVVLMRALAALEPGCDAAPVLERLDRSTDFVETAALVAALGRIGATAAVPRLVALAHRALREDPDLLMTTLVALGRIPMSPDERLVAGLAQSVRRAARGNAARFEIEHDCRELPDIPDPRDLRAETLEQLAVLLRVRLGGVPSAGGELHELLDDSRSSRPGGTFANRPISVFWPAAQMPVIETLPHLGADGQRRLEAIVDDDSTDPVLRVAALAQLPMSARDALADHLLAGAVKDLPIELRLAAVQVLDLDGGEALTDRCRTLLGTFARAVPGVPRAQERQLWQSALQALDRRGMLRSADLLPLLAHVRATPAGRFGAAAQRAWIVDQATALVSNAAAGLKSKELDTRIVELVDRVIAAHVDPRFVEASREATAKYVRGLLAGVAKKRKDAAYLALVARSIADYFVANASVSVLAESHEFAAIVPLEESVVLALGRLREPEATAAIAALLQEKGLHGRAHVCLAAGMSGDRTLLPPLVRQLLDEDGFVRLCAYEALRQLTGKDVWADWLYGDIAERGAAAQEWFRVCVRSGR